jgi:hypothetical protein
MPIDPSIALGVRPVEQPNMLAQYAQMMAIKQAQQEMEGSAGVNKLARGGERDPYAYIQYGKQGQAAAASITKIEKEQLEASERRLTMTGQIAGYVRDNPTPENFITAVGTMKQNGLLTQAQADRVIADAGNDPVKIKSYADKAASDALKEADKLTARTRIQAANIGAVAGNRNATVNEQRFALEKAEQENIARILRGEPPVPTSGAPVAPMTGGGGGVAPMTGGGRAPMTAPMTGVAPVNALVPNAAPVAGGAPMPAAPVVQPNVNALNATPVAPNVNALTTNAVPPQIAQLQTQISQLLSSGSPKAIAAADALIKQHNLLMPTRQIVQNTKGEYNAVDQRTGASTPVLDDNGKPLVGKLPPEQFESSYKQFVGKAKGERDVAMVTSATSAAENLPKLYETLDQLKTSDAITGFGANIIKNIEAARAKFTGDIKAGKKVADTEILDAMLGSDVFPMIQSLGIGAKGMDTPAEREYLRGVMTGTITMNKDALIKLTEIRKNIEERAITRYNQNVENGTLNKFFETEGRAPQ